MTTTPLPHPLIVNILGDRYWNSWQTKPKGSCFRWLCKLIRQSVNWLLRNPYWSVNIHEHSDAHYIEKYMTSFWVKYPYKIEYDLIFYVNFKQEISSYFTSLNLLVIAVGVIAESVVKCILFLFLFLVTGLKW